MVQYSLFMLKVPLNSNQPTNLCTCVPVPVYLYLSVPVYLYVYLCVAVYTCTSVDSSHHQQLDIQVERHPQVSKTSTNLTALAACSISCRVMFILLHN